MIILSSFIKPADAAGDAITSFSIFNSDEISLIIGSLIISGYPSLKMKTEKITEDNKKSQRYVRGVSGEFCFSEVTDQRKLQFAERQKQIDLAKGRGEQHIGQDVSKVNYERRLKKQSRMFQGE